VIKKIRLTDPSVGRIVETVRQREQVLGVSPQLFQVAEEYKKCCRTMWLQSKEKVKVPKPYSGEGLSIIRVFSLFGGHWNVYTAKSESGL
jgi:hypothetical protein